MVTPGFWIQRWLILKRDSAGNVCQQGNLNKSENISFVKEMIFHFTYVVCNVKEIDRNVNEIESKVSEMKRYVIEMKRNVNETKCNCHKVRCNVNEIDCNCHKVRCQLT